MAGEFWEIFLEKTQSGGEKCDTDGIRPGSAYSRGEERELGDGVAEGRKYGMAEERERLLRSAIRVQRGKGQKEEDIIAFLAECFELPEAQARECYQRIAQGEAL